MRRGRDRELRYSSSHETSSNGAVETLSDSDTESQSTSSLTNDRRSNSERIAPSSSSMVESASYGPHWSAKRHITCGNPSPSQHNFANMAPWRQPDKLRTSNAALVVCLNIDVDPPDVVKTDPCATLECWVDPHSLPSNKALEAIGNNLHHQFECLSPRIKFKPYLDPSYEETQKFCTNLRKMAKDERCLFYYNGHGVPKPTPSGELWVFNRSYSQYIPVSLIEIQNWLGSPCIYIWDCSAAGNLLTNFINFAKKRDSDMITLHGGYADGMQPFMESIQLAACLAHEQLPMCPELPADLFTSCLTSPIDIALRWFVMQNQLPNNVTLDMVQRLPGDLRDRRTPLGELNWIFTAVTDTIAWTTFSREIFTKLYRSDLLIASLFRNFLLAERIMKNYHCTPHTFPPLPPTNTHPMWAQWDLAVDACLRQLPDLLGNEETVFQNPKDSTYVPEKPYTYVPSRFFTDHLTAFEVWVSRGGSALTKRGPGSLAPATGSEAAGFGYGHDGRLKADASGKDKDSSLVPRKPPEQLPILLQLLLSQPHRLRALILLSQFVDLGPWAVHYALAIGVFPFISKLLQSPAPDLRPVLIFIWARILAVDPSCQSDLYHSHGYKYFANALAARQDVSDRFPNQSEHAAMCCFILSAICRGFPQGQTACWQERVFDYCFERLEEDDFLSRQWMALCIGQMWDGNDDFKIYGVDRGTQDKLIAMLADNSAEVRTAALFALGTFMGASGSADPEKRGGDGTGSMYHLDERTHFRLEVAVGTGAALTTRDDASPMVRKELLVLLSCLVKEWRGHFVIAAWIYWEEEYKRSDHPHPQNDEDMANQAITEWLDNLGDDETYREDSRVLLSSFYTIYVFLLEMSVDPYPEVAAYAQTLVDYVMALLLESPFARLGNSTLTKPPKLREPRVSQLSEPRTRLSSLQSNTRTPFVSPPQRVPLTRSDSTTSTFSSSSSNILRRTASFANSLKTLAGSYAFPSGNSDEALSVSTAPSGSKLKGDYIDVSCPPSPNLNMAEYTSPYLTQSPVSPTGQTLPEKHSPPEYFPCEVMEALIEEDMERLRARRRKKSQPRLYQQYAHADNMLSPSGSTFSHDSTSSSVNVPLGLGTGAGFKDVLPLKSRFYDWCCEYFTETQMRQPESEEPGSVQYNEQMWRRQRNEEVLQNTDPQADLAPHCSWDRPVTTVNHTGHPSRMAFHAFDPHLFVANETNMISVYDWTQRKRLLTFNNGNPTGSSITSLHCINQDVGGMIMAGSSDGIIHLYRNYDPAYFNQPLQMVSSFRALNTLVPIRRGSGLVLEWLQGPGIIVAGGDSRTIKIWDAHRERSLSDVLTQSESPTTAITSDPDNNSLLLVGFGDGNIKLFDRRLDEGDSVVRVWREHSSRLHSVRWQRGANKELISASVDGEVKLWDMREAKSPISRWMLCSDGLSAFDVHTKASVFAVSSTVSMTKWRQQTTIVHSFSATPNQSPILSRLAFSTGMHAPAPHPSFSPPICNSLAFHPNEMILGIGGIDGTIKLTGCKLPDEDLSIGDGQVTFQNGHT